MKTHNEINKDLVKIMIEEIEPSIGKIVKFDLENIYLEGNKKLSMKMMLAVYMSVVRDIKLLNKPLT